MTLKLPSNAISLKRTQLQIISRDIGNLTRSSSPRPKFKFILMVRKPSGKFLEISLDYSVNTETIFKDSNFHLVQAGY